VQLFSYQQLSILVEASVCKCETYTISRIEVLKHPQYECDVKIMRLQIPGPGDGLKAE
jgi:hypothetical protein